MSSSAADIRLAKILSTSVPMYPVAVNDVASAITKGTLSIFDIV